MITVATAIHWFNIPTPLPNRSSASPEGVIAVWTYKDMMGVNPEVEQVSRRLHEICRPYWKPGVQYAFEEYRNLPFPFESVGLGCEGQTVEPEMPKEMSLETFLGVQRTSSGGQAEWLGPVD
ncbi:hypothetical protein BT93_L0546 [Corymbia citriodora subsp. variegata]|uniref:Uncharacterized protein n=1 Tax=Corymbia citriodora subsp. variegata TaxID=360336 RepID=A0A8T0D0M8_CORYI|nr:hypothetical protein BT93_L0546 [Corymbia citriodora subsp. variegata]